MTNETKWSIDKAHSEIAFKIKHLMITNVRGVFKEFDADIATVGDDFTTAVIDVWIDPASIDTGDKQRDGHVRSAEFFDIAQYKEITFSDASIERAEKSTMWELWGKLTMKGVTKKIKLTAEYSGKVTDPWGNEKAGFTVTGKIDRRDWGLVWNSELNGGGLLLGDDVTINCEIQLVKSNGQEMKLKEENSQSEHVIT